jgi:hypothetical protein
MAMLLPSESPTNYCALRSGMEISDARIDFSAAALGIGTKGGSSQMARLTETLNLQRGLLRHLGEQPNVTLLDKTMIENIFEDDIPGGGRPMAQLSDGVVLRARLLIFCIFLRTKVFPCLFEINVRNRWHCMISAVSPGKSGLAGRMQVANSTFWVFRVRVITELILFVSDTRVIATRLQPSENLNFEHVTPMNSFWTPFLPLANVE